MGTTGEGGRSAVAGEDDSWRSTAASAWSQPGQRQRERGGGHPGRARRNHRERRHQRPILRHVRSHRVYGSSAKVWAGSP